MTLPDFRPFIERAPEYEIRDGVMCVDFGSWSVYMPLRVFRVAQARALKAIREHDAAGKVLPVKGRH